VVLVTGANGEMGHGLIQALANEHGHDVLGLDIKDLEPDVAAHCRATITGDILDRHLLERLVSEFEIHTVFHLAALLSTRSEFTPETAHEVNVTGTLNLLKLATEQARWHGNTVKFLFPSSIAVYGLPDLAKEARQVRAVERLAEGEQGRQAGGQGEEGEQDAGDHGDRLHPKHSSLFARSARTLQGMGRGLYSSFHG
jgi:nucleoside-diphosphate-sugar epimerase